MKIDCLIVRPDSPKIAPGPDNAAPLAIGLKRRGLQPVILTTSGDTESPGEGVPVINLDYKERVARGERWPREKAYAYGIRNFRRFAFCEHCYGEADVKRTPYELLIEEVPAAFAEVHRFFAEHDIRAVLHTNAGGEIMRQAISIVAHAQDVPSGVSLNTAYFSNRVLLARDDRGRPVLPRPALRFADLPSDRQKFILDDLECKRNSHPLAATVPERTFSRLAVEFVRRGKFRELCRVKRAVSTTLKFLKYEWGKRYWTPFDPSLKYVYFPLAHSAESTVILGSPKCYRQDFVAEFVDRMLPEGLMMLVKQHVHYPAEFLPADVIARIARLPAVRMVPPSVNGWEIMRHAKAVIVIHGTSGYEGLLLRKPVVVLGRPLYRGWGVTHDVTDLDELPGILDKALASELSEERLLDFLASFESVHFRGSWFDPPLDPDAMADAVVAFFGRMASGLA